MTAFQSCLLVCAVAFLFACNSNDNGLGPAKPVASFGPTTNVDVVPADTRSKRRMNVDQLQASIARVTGGLQWTRDDRNMLEDLAATLGKPDYIEVTREDLEPSVIFLKFLDDAARGVCQTLVEVEPQRPEEERTFFTRVAPGSLADATSEDIDANLQELVLRFHGRALPLEHPELSGWRWLFDSSLHAAETPEAAWQNVCIGLISHPDFYIY